MSQPQRTIAIDLAKDVFEICVGDGAGRILERQRLSRKRLPEWLVNQPASIVAMEACGTCHFWSRVVLQMGHTPTLLPAQYVRGYRRRNKTDRADAEAILEASRSRSLPRVAVKSPDQQAVLAWHRIREQTKRQRTARINLVRGLLREFGVYLPEGAQSFLKQAPEAVEDPAVPGFLIAELQALLLDIRRLSETMTRVERQLTTLVKSQPTMQQVTSIPGIGVLGGSALVASVSDPHSFRSPRQLAAWMGLTPKESSSGTKRRLGAISKAGDVYLRTLLVHGARSVLRAARVKLNADKPLSHLEHWALSVADRRGHNKAAAAVANKLARIAWAVMTKGQVYQARPAPITATAA